MKAKELEALEKFVAIVHQKASFQLSMKESAAFADSIKTVVGLIDSEKKKIKEKLDQEIKVVKQEAIDPIEPAEGI